MLTGNEKMNQSSQDNPGVIARPPRLYLGTLAIGLLIDWAWPAPIAPTIYQLALGAILVATGLTILVQSMRTFSAHGTNVPTSEPSTALVTDGPYVYSRNPIYVGLSFIYLGLAVAIDSLWIMALLIPLLVVMTQGVIAREERYLEGKFGDAYLTFKQQTPRWF